MTPKHEATDAMGMERQPIDHETEAFKVLQVIEQRAWALGDDQYARLAKEAKDHLSRSTTQPAEQGRAKVGETRVYAGRVLRLFEIGPEGGKWEDIGAAERSGDAGREAVWKVVHETWKLLDEGMTENGVTTVDPDRWKAACDAMDALEALVPDSEGPFWGGFPVNYLWPKGAEK